MDKRGFTLVEAVIPIVVIAVLLSLLIPVIRERERVRLQALADSEPWEVFALRARPIKEEFEADEDIVVTCEIVNATNYPLTLPARPANLQRAGPAWYWGFGIVIQGKKYGRTLRSVLPTRTRNFWNTAIAPGESAHFETRLDPFGVNDPVIRVVNPTAGFHSTLPNLIVISTINDENRFPSNAFRLFDARRRELPTFSHVASELLRQERMEKEARQ
jgi:hypothetical protein